MDHGLQQLHRNRVLLQRLREQSPLRAAPTEPVGSVVTLPTASPWGPRDGADRAVAIGSMDPQNRVSVTKVADTLGWDDQTPVVVVCEPGRVRVRAGTPTVPTEIASRYAAGRLTLPAPARGVLRVGAGDTVIAATVVGTGELVLAAGVDLAAVLTGAIQTPAPPKQAPVTTNAQVKASSVRPAWRSATANG